jgi:hypothetical protein
MHLKINGLNLHLEDRGNSDGLPLAPPASGTIHWCGFWRRNAGSPALDRYCRRDRSWPCPYQAAGGASSATGFAQPLRCCNQIGKKYLVDIDAALVSRQVAFVMSPQKSLKVRIIQTDGVHQGLKDRDAVL